MNKNHVTRRHVPAMVSLQRDDFRPAGLQRKDLDVRGVDTCSSGNQDGLPAGENLRPVAEHRTLELPGCSAGGSEAKKIADRIRRDDDGVIFAPTGAALITETIAQHHWRAALNGNFLHFAISEEAEPLAVWGEKGVLSVLSPGQRSDLGLVEQAHSEARFAIQIPG